MVEGIELYLIVYNLFEGSMFQVRVQVTARVSFLFAENGLILERIIRQK